MSNKNHVSALIFLFFFSESQTSKDSLFLCGLKFSMMKSKIFDKISFIGFSSVFNSNVYKLGLNINANLSEVWV